MSIEGNCDFCTKLNCDECHEKGYSINWELNKDVLFNSVANEIANTLSRKNHDYGDSFHKIYSEFGDLSTYIRLTDKIGRLKTLINKEAKVKNEPIEDAYRDIAGYCILTLVSKQLLQNNKEVQLKYVDN